MVLSSMHTTAVAHVYEQQQQRATTAHVRSAAQRGEQDTFIMNGSERTAAIDSKIQSV
jgi:hypothetical protein